MYPRRGFDDNKCASNGRLREDLTRRVKRQFDEFKGCSKDRFVRRYHEVLSKRDMHFDVQPSVDTRKPASRGHFKTGQWTTPRNILRKGSSKIELGLEIAFPKRAS